MSIGMQIAEAKVWLYLSVVQYCGFRLIIHSCCKVSVDCLFHFLLQISQNFGNKRHLLPKFCSFRGGLKFSALCDSVEFTTFAARHELNI
jgi:hypothetical protein